MMRPARASRSAIGITLLLLAAATAGAQTTGQIEGAVADETGAALPGVTVEVSSPALQGTRVAAADSSGGFRFVFLPPGSYTLRCSLAGFSPVEQEGIAVGLGRTATLQVQMQPAFQDEVAVIGAPPVVDVRSAEVGASIDREFFFNLPLGRDFISVAKASPGTGTDASGIVVYGSTGLENAYTIDGVNTASLYSNTPGRALNFELIDEVQVRTGGYAAEFGKATGGAVNVITRSGGNTFHGDVFGYYFSDALQSGPSDEVEAFSRQYGGASTVDAFTEADVGFDLGGYLLKDRLWFFAAYDRVANDQDQKATKDFSSYGGPPAGAIYVTEELRHLWAAKLTWRPADSHSVIASAFGDPRTIEGPIRDLNGEESTFLGSFDVGGETAVLRWEGVLGASLVVDAQLSRFKRSVETGGLGVDVPRIIDHTTPLAATTGVAFNSGGIGGYEDRWDRRDAGRADATLFLSDLAGDHELKAGVEVEDVDLVQNVYRSGGQLVDRYCTLGYQTEAGCPEEWVQYWHYLFLAEVPPGGPTDPDYAGYVTAVQPRAPSAVNQAAYLQDSWRVLPSLTLNLGVRWGHQQFYDYHGASRLPLDDEWAPRVGFAWDVRNDGAAKLYGSWGRFYESAPLMLSLTFNDNVQAENDNRSPSSVECDTGMWDTDPWWGYCVIYAGAPTPVDPAGVGGGYLDEALLGGEVAVARDLVLGAKLVYRTLGRIVEDAASPDGFYMGNPGYGQLVTAPDLRTGQWMLPLPPPERTFKGVELTAVRRFADDWQLMASYLWSKLEGNYDGAYYPDYHQMMPNTSAAYDYGDFLVHNDGYLSNDRRHQAKVSAAYAFPFGLTAGASAYYRSGTPLSALGWSWYGNILYLSQRGAWGRTDDEYEMDLHLAYPIRVGSAQVNLLLDVFNLLDRQGEIERDQRYNLDWTFHVIDYTTGEEKPAIAPGTPCATSSPPGYADYCNPGFNTASTWQDPRSIRFGVRVTF